VWDLGGQPSIRSLWNHYASGTDAIIYVIDANNKNDFAVAKEELQKYYENFPELNAVPILLFANKFDLPNCEEFNTIQEYFNLSGKNYNIVKTCATTGDGLYEGLDWLNNMFDSSVYALDVGMYNPVIDSSDVYFDNNYNDDSYNNYQQTDDYMPDLSEKIDRIYQDLDYNE